MENDIKIHGYDGEAHGAVAVGLHAVVRLDALTYDLADKLKSHPVIEAAFMKYWKQLLKVGAKASGTMSVRERRAFAAGYLAGQKPND